MRSTDAGRLQQERRADRACRDDDGVGVDRRAVRELDAGGSPRVDSDADDLHVSSQRNARDIGQVRVVRRDTVAGSAGQHRSVGVGRRGQERPVDRPELTRCRLLDGHADAGERVIRVGPAPGAVLRVVARGGDHPVDGTRTTDAAAARERFGERQARCGSGVEEAAAAADGVGRAGTGLDDNDVLTGLGEPGGHDAPGTACPDDDPSHARSVTAARSHQRAGVTLRRGVTPSAARRGGRRRCSAGGASGPGG